MYVWDCFRRVLPSYTESSFEYESIIGQYEVV
jgi:hypothetical protein